MVIKEKDFVEIDYKGMLADGSVFDTTKEETAKKHSIHDTKTKYKPLIICIGEGQVVPGLEKAIAGKEAGKSYSINLKAEEAFGKKDAKKIKIVPEKVFRKQNIFPQPGLQVNIDGQIAKIIRANGGRILVDFNHPLAGKDIKYEIDVKRIVTDKTEQIKAFLELVLPISTEVISEGGKFVIKVKDKLPKELTEPLAERIKYLTGASVEFSNTTNA